MNIYVVYYLNKVKRYVVKKFWVDSAGIKDLKENHFARDYSGALDYIPLNLTQVPRSDEDEPSVVESWI